MKNIRSKFVKDSLLDYENLASSLKENTASAVKDLLSETVRDAYAKILTEDEDKDEDDYEIEEVDDTNTEDTEDAEDTADGESESDGSDDSEQEDSDEHEEEEPGAEDSESEDPEAADDEATDVDDLASDESPEEEGWAEFDKYKVSDDEYDFSQANDDEIVKVYKLLKDDDQVLVNVDNDAKKVEVKDNQTGAEYLLDLSSFSNAGETALNDESYDDEADSDLDIDNDMNESRIYEVVLDEYDSHVGYTDSYQKKDVMSTPSNNEPGKNVNDWDAGVPKGSSKPWVGKGKSKPFEKKISEEEEVVEEPVEEATNVGGFVQQNSTSKSHIPNSSGRKARNSSVAGVKTKGTANPRYSEATNESKKMMTKVNNILKENKELKKALANFKNVLKEAAVTNVNLGQIIKLISENSTTKAEKQDIIERFGKEAKTIQESKSLYETISRELKKNVVNINEDKQYSANGSKMINETQIYQSKDMLDSLDLMHRICK